MKKTLIALAAVAAATGAMAQSTVTIDGQVSLGYVKTNDKAATLDSTNGTNQIRFRGTEDLGGGLSASFILAQRFSPESGKEDGTANTRPNYQGESSLSLSGNFGSIKLGRALHALQANVNATDTFAVAYLASTAQVATGYFADASTNGNADGGGQGRTDAISYVSPSFNGLTVSAAYGPKGSQGADQAKEYQSFWVGYTQGPLSVGAGSEKSRDGVGKITAATAIYNFGVARVGVGYGKTTANFATAGFITAGDKLTNWNLMVTAPVGAATLKFGYGVAKNNTTGADVNKKTGLGVDYNLSKRTWIYATTFSDSVRTAASVKSGSEVGIRHTF